MFSVCQDVFCCLHGFLSLIATMRNIVTGFPHRFVKMREVTRLILSRKCCISICPISSPYIAEILVMNVLGCNRKLYSTCVFYCTVRTEINYVSGNDTKQSID